jgi:hypothetical protein
MSQYYQSFKLRIADQDGKRKFWQGVKNTSDNLKQPPARAIEKGTLFHLILEGDNATSLTADGTICVGVQAMAYGRAKFDNLKVPYALAMTLEVEETIRSDVYAYIRQDIEARVQPPIRARVR